MALSRIIPYKRGDYGVLFSDFDAEVRKIKIQLEFRKEDSRIIYCQ